MTAYLRLYGERLVELGYTVLPIKPGSKRPDIKDWPRHATTAANVVAWYSNGRAQHGVGINARNTPAIDVDVLDPTVAGAMADAIDAIFPGHSLLIRTGMAPKFLIPFRSDIPFRKLVSQTYTDGTNDHKVEILGDGQQFVAYAIHPQTEKPYAWFDGVGAEGLRGVPREDLPILTATLAAQVIEAFELLAAERVSVGAWTLKAGALPLETTDNSRVHDDPFAAHSEPLSDLSRAQVETLIHKLNFDERKDWVRAGMMLHHQYSGGEEGLEIWNAWGANSSKWNEKDEQAVWDSFGQRNDAPETLRGLIKQFGQPPSPSEHKPRIVSASEEDPWPQVEWSEFKQGFESIPWIIKGLLPQAEIGFLYGASGSGKTFLALDLAANVARGIDWRGQKTTAVPVVYIAAEAGEGIKKRMAAYDKEFGADGARPRIMAGAPNLLSPDDAEKIITSTNLRGGAGLVIVDTMAASHTGDENSSKDMSMFVSLCKDISAKTGAMVLIVHHTGKDTLRGVRGHSSLYAAADVVLEVFKNEGEKKACLTVVKQKDGETGTEYGFSLSTVEVGVDAEGEAITTCVVHVEKDAPQRKTKEKAVTPGFETDGRFGKARFYLDIIAGLAGLANDPVEESIVINAIQTNKTVNPECEGDFPRPDNIRRTFLTLAKQGKISIEGRSIRLLA
jgi:RecA-family ATPase